jgi:hypothetical protein
MTRFDDSISVVDLGTQSELQHFPLTNPEPPSITTGRRFLYDALNTSSNGEASCSSCHIFGDMDDLAWDLGNPDDVLKNNPIPVNLRQFAIGTQVNFHPLKGPMTTQTLRGLNGSGAMHWRGDRSVGEFGTNAFDEILSFNNFDTAFVGLVGRASEISASEMQQFTDFQLQVMLPPNPIRNLDNSLTTDQAAGRNFFLGPRRADGLSFDLITTNGFTCQGCHELDPAEGEFGTSKNCSFEGEPQVVKIAHLRNLYQKVGMFGMPLVSAILAGDNGNKGAQIRGFGFLHDGSVDTVFRFLRANVFAGLTDFNTGFQSDTQRRQAEAFVLAFDSNLAPIVGQQTTLTSSNAAVAGPRIDLLKARAQANWVLNGNISTKECDLVVKGNVGGVQKAWLFNGSSFTPIGGGSNISDAALRALANTAGQELTYTCVPPGSGLRIAQS